MLASVRTCSLCGVDAHTVHVEADVSPGLPHTQIVGLPDASVRESKDRVQAALRNCGYTLPPARITLNLAPAELPKEGSGFDLPIALALLAAVGELDAARLAGVVFLGELALDGTVRPVRGVLVAALHARDQGARGLVVPAGNVPEALSVKGLRAGAAVSLRDTAERLADPGFWETGTGPGEADSRDSPLDLDDVRGQPGARRALEIAAAGGHNLLLIGPPGTGKTMLARRLPTILPSLGPGASLDATRIHSVAGTLGDSGKPLVVAPFRAPHHTVSAPGLVGGGSPPRPGEVSLAHRGVLFLDELPEFRRGALEALRQPLEEGRVTIVRARRSAAFPARFQLVASMNPCPCGLSGDPERTCTCSSTEVRRYRARVSGPLLDRIDLHIWVPAVDVERLTGQEREEDSAAVRARVERARARQEKRQSLTGVALNAELPARSLVRVCALPPGGRVLLAGALRRRGLSARAVHRVLRVARTLADLEGSGDVTLPHVAEAVRYRLLSDGVVGAERAISARTAS